MLIDALTLSLLAQCAEVSNMTRFLWEFKEPIKQMAKQVLRKVNAMPAIECAASLLSEMKHVLSFLDSSEARALGLGYIALRFLASHLWRMGMPDAKDLAIAIGILYALAGVSVAERAKMFDAQVAQACSLSHGQPAQSARAAPKGKSL